MPLMPTLHLLADSAAAGDCRRAIAPGDRLLLIADGVFAAAEFARTPAAGARIGALEPDAERRGVRLGGIQPLSHTDFVTWAVACERSVTWR